MNRSGRGRLPCLLIALALAGSLTPRARADLLIYQGNGAPIGQRTMAASPLPCSLEEAEAALVVLFFPPLTPPPDGPPPDPPADPPDDPPDPPDDPPDDPPGDPPHHNPEPASLVSGAVGSGLIVLAGWWRRRR